MKKSIKSLLIVSTAAFSIFGAFPAMAATAIDSIELNVISYIKDGDTSSNVSVKSLSYKYDVDDVDVTNEPSDGWEEGDNPKLKITLETDGDDYKFTSSLTKSDVTIKGNDATVTKVTRSSNTKLYVYVTLDDVDDDDDTYIGGQNFGGQLPQQPPAAGGFSQNTGSNSGITSGGAWEKDSRGWKWNNGGYIQNQWQQIDNKWYYFDSNGYMVTGWHQIDGKWYYMDENGEMLQNTITPDGYRVGPDGVWDEDDDD